MRLQLKEGMKDPYDDGPIVRPEGPVVDGVEAVIFVDGSPQFRMESEELATAAAGQLGWFCLDERVIGMEPYGDCLRVHTPGEEVLYYAEWDLTEVPAPNAVAVGQLSAAMMEALCISGISNERDELYALSDSGIIGLWVCVAEVAVAAEIRYGDLWRDEDRNFLDDTDAIADSILPVAREIGKQPQGDKEIAQVLDLFERNNPTAV